MQMAQRLIAVVAISSLTLWAVSHPPRPAAVTLDEMVYQVTVAEMRNGASYYPAMDRGLRAVYGPPVAARDVRLPTLFVLWSWLPSETAHWTAFAIAAWIAGVLGAFSSTAPIGGVLVTWVLLRLGVTGTEGSQVGQVLTTEFWVVPVVMGFLLASRRGLQVVALMVAFLATTIREHAATLLMGVGAEALSRRRLRVPVAVAMAAAVALYVTHTVAVTPFLTADGYHTALSLGGSPLQGFLNMVGFGFTPLWLGLLVWIMGVSRARQTALLPVLGPFLAIPLLGWFIDRPYWGAMVVPLSILLATEVAWELLTRLRRAQVQGAPDPSTATDTP